jgi:hypothetical protein
MTSLLSDGVEIENLDPSEASNFLKGASDYRTVELDGEEGMLGEVRYEIKDERISFSVSAVLPQLSEGEYQVWLKEVDGEGMRKALTLEYLKGGYIGSAAISAETLPFEIVVSKEMTSDAELEEVLLKGVIEEQE